jgi:hypothetical protein
LIHGFLVDEPRVLLWKSLLVSAGMIAFFFAGWPLANVALVR